MVVFTFIFPVFFVPCTAAGGYGPLGARQRRMPGRGARKAPTESNHSAPLSKSVKADTNSRKSSRPRSLSNAAQRYKILSRIK